MKIKRKSSIFTTLLIAMLMLLLVGCSSKESESTGSSESDTTASNETTETVESEETTEYPIVIKHALGETTIEKKPERVATIQWANQDVVLALGVVPVGFSAANFGISEEDNGLLPWTKAKLDELGESNPNIFQDTDGLDFEAISDANPDVILAAYSGITQEEYETLSEIAPVVAYQTSPWVASWREQVMYDAMGMGMEKEGKQLIADTEKLIADKASEHPEIKGKSAAWVNFSAKDLSKMHVYTEVDPRGEFLVELGMTTPEGIASHVTDPESYSLKLSAENVDALNDTDVIISYGEESMLATIQADPILGNVPAIKRGSVVFVGNNTPLAAAANPNPLAIQYTIGDYLDLISAAVNKIED